MSSERPRRRVPHIQDVAVVDSHAVVGGFGAWWLGAVLQEGPVCEALERQLAMSRVTPERRDDVRLACAALLQAGGQWQLARKLAISSTTGDADGVSVRPVVPSKREQLLSSREVGVLLGLSGRHVRHLADTGVLRAARDGGGRWLFNAADIEAERNRRMREAA